MQMRAPARRTTSLLLLVLLPSAAVAAAPAAAPATATRTPQLTAAPSEVKPGEALRLEGRGFPRNAEIVLRAGPPDGETRRIGSARTGLKGRFTAEVQIRVKSDPGRLVAFACHDACRLKASAQFRIVAP